MAGFQLCCFYSVLIVFLGAPYNTILPMAAAQGPAVKIKPASYRNAYITDIIHELEIQKWPPNSRKCLNQTVMMLRGVQNHTLWSTWAWESMNNLPVGQLYGSRHHLGNYDECMTSPWYDLQPELRTQYCLADVTLEVKEEEKRNVTTANPYGSTLDYMQYQTRYSRRVNTFVWGLCIPASCNNDSARVFAKVMIERSPWDIPEVTKNLTIDQCQNPSDLITSKSYDTGFYVFLAFVTILVIASVTCTVIISFKKEDHPDQMVWYCIRSFNIKENSQALFHHSKDTLEVMYGVRFLSIVLIVMGHQIMYYNIGPISNGWKADQELDSGSANLIIHDDVLVDTFFMMSGVLYMRAFVYFHRIPSVGGAMLKRYLRLGPSLAMVIFYINTTLKYSGSGPLWPNYVKQETGYCLKNWWTNLLMVNNFIDPENMCYHNTWYIPCDFQMFTGALLLTQFYFWNKRAGQMAAGCLALLAVLIPGYVTYKHDLPPVPMMVYETLLDSRNSFPLNIFYIKTYNRFGPYIVGLAVGAILVFFAKDNNKTKHLKFCKVKASICAWTGLLLMLVVLLYGAHLHRAGWGRVESVLFAAVNRTIWALGLALLILSCAFGDVPIIKPILTWYPWVPLSKLAFGIYITHGLVIYRNIFVTRNLHHHDDGNIAVDTMGVLVWSTILAYLLWIFVEAPICNIFNIYMIPRQLVKKLMDKDLTKEDIQLAVRETSDTSKGTEQIQCNKEIQVNNITFSPTPKDQPWHHTRSNEDPYTSSDSTQ